MRHPALHSALSVRKLPVWGVCLVMAALTATFLSAKPAPRGKKMVVQALPRPEMDRSSTRFVLPSNQPVYATKMLARMSMSTRTSDPFGRSQDPDATPAPTPETGTKGTRITTLQKKQPLKEVVSLLKVTTVIPKDKRFLVSDRSFRVGDTLLLTNKSKSTKVEVVAVSESKIDFRDPESGETAALELDLLPPGMAPGTTLSATPGMLRNEKDAPIILDAPTFR